MSRIIEIPDVSIIPRVEAIERALEHQSPPPVTQPGPLPPISQRFGQPIKITNNFTTLAPKGGFAFLDKSAGSDADHRGIVQPLYPGIAQDLVILKDDIPAGGDGLGWPCDGCVHSIYDPLGICVIGQRVGAQAGSWAPMAFGLGPVTVTAAAVNGLAMGLCHGMRGDTKVLIDSTGKMYAVKNFVYGLEYSVDFDTTPGVPAVSAL